jgi:alpha,alpha-trehalose phosphorylase
MAVVFGLAGLRHQGGKLVFNPRPLVQKLRFTLTVRGQRIEVDIADAQVSYTLARGKGLTIWHRNDPIQLKKGKPVRRTLR